MEIVELAPDDVRLGDVYPVMRELRTELTDDEFRRRYAEGHPDGYRIVAVTDEGEWRAAAGYRVMTSLAHGRFLYVDDLVTRPDLRSRGYGKALTDWLQQRARDEGCDYVSLDSNTGRLGAHRFYFREGWVITSFHFGKELGPGG